MLSKTWNSGIFTIACASLILPQFSSASTFKDVPKGIWYAHDLEFLNQKAG